MQYHFNCYHVHFQEIQGILVFLVWFINYKHLNGPRLFWNTHGENTSFKNSHPYMQQIQHQTFVAGRLYCDSEAFLEKESVTIRNIKDFNYEK